MTHSPLFWTAYQVITFKICCSIFLNFFVAHHYPGWVVSWLIELGHPSGTTEVSLWVSGLFNEIVRLHLSRLSNSVDVELLERSRKGIQKEKSGCWRRTQKREWCRSLEYPNIAEFYFCFDLKFTPYGSCSCSWSSSSSQFSFHASIL